MTKTVHASSMVTVDATQRFKPEGESSSIPLSAQHGEEFSVDCILDEKAEDGKVFYKVRWVGYGSNMTRGNPGTLLKTALL